MTTNERATALSQDEIVALLESHDRLTAEITELRRQVAWFQRQLFVSVFTR
jgi:hypothetical protein